MALNRSQWLRWFTVVMLFIGIGLALYLTIYVWRRVDRPVTADSNPRGDFSFFYTAAKAMTQGQDIYTAQPPDKTRPGYIYPPLIAFLYQPLASLSISWAARISLLFNVAAITVAIGAASRSLLQRFGQDSRWPFVLAVGVFAALLSLDKIKGDLQMLQTNSLIVMGMALGLWLLDSHPFWAGAAIGFSLNIKYQALALLLYLVLRRKWKAAGATVLWTGFWAFLPALSVGFSRDADYLVRGFSGVLRLVGLNLGADVANVEPISSGFSVSITSAAARFVEHHHLSVSPFLISGILALIFLSVLALLYRARQIPVLTWPRDAAQKSPPWQGVIGIEWVAVIGCVLAFSPQTNMRHMVLTTMINVLGVVVVVASRGGGGTRAFAVAGLMAAWMGMNLPFGHRVDLQATPEVIYWHGIGGPSLSILVAIGLIAWAGLKAAGPRASGERVPEPSGSQAHVAVEAAEE